LEIIFISVNSINYSSFGNFSPTFPYRKIEAEKKKKKKKKKPDWNWLAIEAG